NGVTTRALFIAAAKNPASRKTYQKEFPVFNHLLQDIGFVNGYKDLKAANVENLFIDPGTVGNLGFFNKESNYIYVTLNPAGESENGVAAWKITGPGGCSFYILHTCGNAFFAKDPSANGAGCCREVTIKAVTDTLKAGAARERPLQLRIRLYQGVISAGRKGKTDTAVRLLRSIDTVTRIKDSTGRWTTVTGDAYTNRMILCMDTVLSLHIPLKGDTAAGGLSYTFADTSYIRLNDK